MRFYILTLLLFLFSLTACSAQVAVPAVKLKANGLIQHDQYTYQIVNQYPHNHESFTQGLIYHQGHLLETTGLRTLSYLYKVDLKSGKALMKHKLKDEYFGEGMTLLNGQIYQVTYEAKLGFIYSPETFERLGTFNIATNGWGLTHNNRQLILSDGTDRLYFIDPTTFEVVRTLKVFDNQGPVKYLNELEFVDGLILANVWYEDYIVAIDPRSGKVVSTIDLRNLSSSKNTEDVYNGIAWDKQNQRLFVTGKRWPTLYEIRLVPKPFAKRL